jgi:hypothetical protein
MDDKIAKMNSSGHEDLYTVRCARIHAVACIPCDLEEQNLTPGNFAHQFIEKRTLDCKINQYMGYTLPRKDKMQYGSLLPILSTFGKLFALAVTILSAMFNCVLP